MYKLCNNCNKCPSFYLQTDSPGHFDKFVGDTFNEAIAQIYRMEEKHAFKELKEIYDVQIYKHCFSARNGYSVEAIDMSTLFFTPPELGQAQESGVDYVVFSDGSEKGFAEAKAAIVRELHPERTLLETKVERAQKELDDFEGKITAMYNSPDRGEELCINVEEHDER